MKRRSNGVQGANYVVHIRHAQIAKTLCGRVSANCYPDGANLSKAAKEEQCCKSCARKAGGR